MGRARSAPVIVLAIAVLVYTAWPTHAGDDLRLAADIVAPGEQSDSMVSTVAGTRVEQGAVPLDLTSAGAIEGPWKTVPRSAMVPEPWTWQAVPEGLIYRSYLAGARESRMASQWVYEKNLGWIWDVALGGRAGILRYGTTDPFQPEGWQLDIEGAAFPRLDMEECLDVVATDYRFGIPVTYGRGPYQTKLAFYHLSSHLGDEYMLKHPGAARINFSRNALVWGHSYFWTNDVRLYGEVGWAVEADGGSRPWEFQFGVDYSPAAPSGVKPVPFVAVNSHLREEVDFGGNLVLQTGLQWRGTTGHLFRMGMQYYTGKTDQYEFFRSSENKVGLAMWYDF